MLKKLFARIRWTLFGETRILAWAIGLPLLCLVAWTILKIAVLYHFIAKAW